MAIKVSNTTVIDDSRNLLNITQYTGNFTASGDITAFSDIRLKQNIEKIENALEKVTQINGVTFDRLDSDKRSTGLIAQELEEVLPEAVHENEDGYKSVSYGNVVGLLVEAIKEQQRQIEELKKD